MADKSYRVIAAISGNRTHRTVNIITDGLAADKHHSVKKISQATPLRNEFETVQAGATGTNASPPPANGLRTIFISGYNGPQ
jgi:hypothetical protein